MDNSLNHETPKKERIYNLNQTVAQTWRDDLHRGLALAQEAYDLAMSEPDYPQGVADAQLNLGRIHYRLAQYTQGQAHLLQALKKYQEIQNPIGEAHAWTGLGLIHWRLADYPTASDYHIKALQIFRAEEETEGEAIALSHLGLVYGLTQDTQAALTTYKQLLAIHQASGNRQNEGFALNNLAMAYCQSGNLEQARACILQSLQIAREENNDALEVVASDTYGTILLAQGEAEQALTHFQHSAHLANEKGYRHDELSALLNIGRAFAAQNQVNQALQAWQRVLEIGASLGAKDDLRKCHHQMAKFFKHQGDLAAALTHYEQFHELDRLIFNETADMRQKTLEVSYEVQAAQQKNLLLEKEIAERRQVEEALRASQESLHTLIQASPDSIYFKDGQGRWLVANQAGLNAFQMQGLAYRGKTDAELARDTPFFSEALLHCVRTDEETWRVAHTTRATETIPQPDGTALIFDVIKVPLFNEDGSRRGLVIIGRDVTAQMEAETAVRHREQEQRSLYNMVRLMCDNVPDLIWAKDLNGRYLFTNQATCDKLLNAHDTSEPIGKTDHYFMQRERATNPDDPQWYTFGEICVSSDEIVLQDKQAQRFDEYGNVQGQFLYLDVYKAPFWNEEGVLIGTVGCGRVVTEEKKREIDNHQMAKALQASEERLRLMVQHMPVMMDALDAQGNIVFWNEECERVTGYSAAEIINNPQAMTLLYPDENYRQQMLQEWATRGNHYRNWEWELTCKDGTQKTISWSNVSERFPLPGWVSWGIGVDVSERQRAETALRQAQKTESLGVLAGGVAHDFNNLLVAMLGQMSLAMVKLRPEHQAWGHVEKAVKAAERAADLTQKMLAYSGRGHFAIQSLDLNALIAENLHLFQASIPKNVRLDSALLPDLPLIEADAGQMQQVIMNLIINAAEAIGEQPGQVLVSTGEEKIDEEQDEKWRYTGQTLVPGNYVFLEVRDDGKGMDENTLASIFDPFFTTKESGHGLGLAAVLGIMRGHQGGIHVVSEPDKGTTFRLLFPASQMAKLKAVEETAVSAPPQITAYVLVIDDEEPVCQAITDILALINVKTFTAPDGPIGLEIYQNHMANINLVILDLSMPGMSGEETFEKLRQLNPNVSVLLSSGYNQAEATRGFVGQGLAGFIQKPYSASDLIDKVSQLLTNVQPISNP